MDLIVRARASVLESAAQQMRSLLFGCAAAQAGRAWCVPRGKTNKNNGSL
jgi:hypothetical protein